CDRAAGNGILADHRAQQAGLADAVAAEHAHHLARFGRDRDAAQRLGRAVIEADVFYLEHRGHLSEAVIPTPALPFSRGWGSEPQWSPPPERGRIREGVILVIAPNTLRSPVHSTKPDRWF